MSYMILKMYRHIMKNMHDTNGMCQVQIYHLIPVRRRQILCMIYYENTFGT